LAAEASKLAEARKLREGQYLLALLMSGKQLYARDAHGKFTKVA
jgi:hypothetical protein